MKISTLTDNVIEIWFGDIATIPSGWVICDGKIHNGVQTKDLRGVYLKGLGSGESFTGTVVPYTTALPNNTVNIDAGGAHSHLINTSTGTTADAEGQHAHLYTADMSTVSNVVMNHWNFSTSGLANSNNYNWGRMLYNVAGTGSLSGADVAVRVENATDSTSHKHTIENHVLNDGNTNSVSHGHTFPVGDSTTEPKKVVCHLVTFVGW